MLTNVECHRRTVLERRKRLGGYRMVANVDFLSLGISTSIQPSRIFILPRGANMSHVSPLLVRGSGERR